MTKIAVTGASGQLGRLAIAAIKARNAGADVVALVRNTAADVSAFACAINYTKPETRAYALAGVGVLMLISANDFKDRAGQHQNVITAAKSAGVGHIIYTSILKDAASPMVLAQDHIATEAALAD